MNFIRKLPLTPVEMGFPSPDLRVHSFAARVDIAFIKRIDKSQYLGK